ncbi:MAG: endolytic transglycosylase MltG [Odoribacter sp.]|nr:endolytic transglycosylase MltG [Odoribacter sp.]
MKKKTVWLSIVFAIIAVVGITALTIMSARFDKEVAVRVNIPKGASKSDVKDSLTCRLGDNYGSLVYRLWALASGDPMIAHGSYLIEPGTSALRTANDISKGQQTPVRVTLNNMRTLDDLTKRLGSKIEASPSEFKEALTRLLASDEKYGKPEEFAAAFVPDTYEFYWTDSPETVISKLVAERDNFWNEERLAKAARLGLSPVEVTTIASIVEEESNKSDEHPMIARLYMNRLDKGMKLQADPTVKFAVGDFSLRRITGAHLRTDSPYNTYRNTGLPPGPIRIPRKSTIDAVLDAPDHNYIYMCAKEDFSGRHNFAVDYTTHKKNAKRYQAQLNRRGIRR